MKFYFVQDAVNTDYYATLREAHRAAKNSFGRHTVGIDELEIATDKQSLLGLLRYGESRSEVIRSWELTDRGGLRKVEALR